MSKPTLISCNEVLFRLPYNGHVSIDGQGSELFGIEDAEDEAINALIEIMPFVLRPGHKETSQFASAMKAEMRFLGSS